MLLGDWLATMGDQAAAAKEFRRGLEAEQEMAKRWPEKAQPHRAAEAASKLASALVALREYAEAFQWMDWAEARLVPLMGPGARTEVFETVAQVRINRGAAL